MWWLYILLCSLIYMIIFMIKMMFLFSVNVCVYIPMMLFMVNVYVFITMMLFMIKMVFFI